jgi:hypothetical protein
LSKDEAFVDAIGEGWLVDAFVCKVGDLVFVAPADRAKAAYWVVQQSGGSVIRLASGDLAVDDAPNLHVRVSDRNQDGHFDSVSYSTWKWKGDRYLSAEDWNLDGQVDVRSLEQPGGSTVHQGWAGGGWQEYSMSPGWPLVSDATKRLERNALGELEIVNVAE